VARAAKKAAAMYVYCMLAMELGVIVRLEMCMLPVEVCVRVDGLDLMVGFSLFFISLSEHRYFMAIPTSMLLRREPSMLTSLVLHR
jgi:hypothetical protein